MAPNNMSCKEWKLGNTGKYGGQIIYTYGKYIPMGNVILFILHH